MNTDELIRTLAADARSPAVSLSAVWWGAAGLAVALAAAVFFATLGPRPDIAAAAETPRFLFKFIVTIALAASAFGLARALSWPGEAWRRAMPFVAIAPALIAMAVVVELVLLPEEMWSTRIIGTNSLVCLIYVPLIGLGPLGVFLLAIRHGATTRPALAGMVAGVLAGGIAATFYAAQCTDDSPLFVATWYTIAIALFALVGGAIANRFCRW